MVKLMEHYPHLATGSSVRKQQNIGRGSRPTSRHKLMLWDLQEEVDWSGKGYYVNYKFKIRK